MAPAAVSAAALAADSAWAAGALARTTRRVETTAARATAGRAAERNVAVNLPLLEDDARRAELDGRYGGLGQRIDECARGIIGNMDG